MPNGNSTQKERIDANMAKLRRERRRRALIQFEMGTAKFLRYEAVYDLRRDERLAQ
jgi:hypothetical protein